jgi:hypothetical protein
VPRRWSALDGQPTFSALFARDDHGHLVVNERGAFVLTHAKRSDFDLPDFHALRHGAAMDCDDAEEARDLLRHRNSNVTGAIYRGHFTDERSAALGAKMEARHGSTVEAPEPAPAPGRRCAAAARAGGVMPHQLMVRSISYMTIAV